MKVFRNIFTYLNSFLIMVFVCLMVLCYGVAQLFLNDDKVFLTLGRVDAYQLIHDNVADQLKDVMLLNNIPLTTFDEFVPVSEVWEIVDRDVTQVLQFVRGERTVIDELDMSVYEARFDERMGTFFAENGMYLSEDQKSDLLVLKDDVLQIVERSLRFINFSELTKLGAVQQVGRLLGMIDLNMIVIGLLVAIVGLIGANMLLWRRRIHRGLLASGYGLVAGGLMMFIVFLSGYVSGFYNHFIIYVAYIQKAVGLFIGDLFKLLFTMGLIVAVIGFGLMVPYWGRLYKRYMGE